MLVLPRPRPCIWALAVVCLKHWLSAALGATAGLAWLFFLAYVFAASGVPSPPLPPPPGPPVIAERGLASWYGLPEHGRRTASGEVYNMYGITAAHPSLPFGTRVRVRNLKNGRQVEAVVTDRLPRVWTGKGRVIDMSLGAAFELRMVHEGLVPVEVAVLNQPE